MPDSSRSAWSGPNSIQPDDDFGDITGTTRELRTRSATPCAPHIDSLFRRDGPVPRQTIVVWDPGQAWPAFSLTQLGGSEPPGRLHRVLLRQEGASEALAEFLLAWLPAREAGQPWGVVEVVTAPGDPMGTRIALTLLEQADRAVVLAGGAGDKDLMRRIGDFVRSAQWDGPSLLMVSPADKPSRADRLRRGGWPRGLRVHVLEVFASPEPGWTQQLLAMVLGDTATTARQATEPAPAASGALPRSSAAAPPQHDPLSHALSLAARGPGVIACALLDATDGKLVAAQGLIQTASEAAGCAVQMWLAQQGQSPQATEFTWSTATRQHIVLPLRQQQLLLAVVDREFGDPASARWHLALARSHLI